MMCILDRLEGRWLQKGNACARGGEESPYSASGGSDDGHELAIYYFVIGLVSSTVLMAAYELMLPTPIECRSHLSH
jgi:hypothetical protein